MLGLVLKEAQLVLLRDSAEDAVTDCDFEGEPDDVCEREAAREADAEGELEDERVARALPLRCTDKEAAVLNWFEYVKPLATG